LVGGSGQSGGGVDAEENVVEGFDVTVDGESFSSRGGRGVGGSEQRGQGGLHVALDGTEVGLGFVANGGGGFPTINVDDGKRGAQDV
jgi:hypothetical protein